jgi:Cdc6-like AAA superfamily ATPase
VKSEAQRSGVVSWIGNLIARLTGRAPEGGAEESSAPAYESQPAASPAVLHEAPFRQEAPAASAFPRFQSTASDRVDPQAGGDRFANVRLKLRNAYTPSLPVSDRKRFAGRNNVLNAVIRALEDQRLHIIIYGDRGIGKTSLLHVLSQAAREARYIVVYVSCGEASNFNDTFRAVATEVPALYHSGVGATETTEPEGRSTLADMLPEEPVTPRFISDLFAKLVGTRVLVVLDEFDRVESSEFRRTVAELIKNLSDRAVRVQLIIAGVASDLTELFEYIPSIRRNVFALQVPKMEAAEIRHLVNTGEQTSGISFESVSTDFVVFVAHGSPYLASLLSHHAGLAALDQSRTTVAIEDVSTGIDRALDELRARISKASQLQIDQGVSEGMRNILGLLAGAALFAGGRFSAGDIDALYTNPADAAKCKGLIANLASHKVLIEASDQLGKGYRFLEGSVPAYLWITVARKRFLKSQKPAPSEAPAEATADSGAAVRA